MNRILFGNMKLWRSNSKLGTNDTNEVVHIIYFFYHWNYWLNRRNFFIRIFCFIIIIWTVSIPTQKVSDASPKLQVLPPHLKSPLNSFPCPPGFLIITNAELPTSISQLSKLPYSLCYGFGSPRLENPAAEAGHFALRCFPDRPEPRGGDPDGAGRLSSADGHQLSHGKGIGR